MKTAVIASLVGAASAKVYFKDSFASEADFKKKWTVGSDWKSAAETGTWALTKGDIGSDLGLTTGPSGEARFHSISAQFDSELSNKDSDLVISFTARHEQNLQCGGAYLKLLPSKFDAKKFGGDEPPYSVMFGPDICGMTRKTHAIFAYKGTNLENKKTIKMESDRLSHRYTLIVHPDNTYQVDIDGVKAESGNLVDDYSFLKPKMIKDPAQSKPADWVDDAKMPDVNDVKPAGYDDIPAKIPDPAAKKPEDWDTEEDGEWEAPQIDNPEYKGPWIQKKVDNPDYKGPWVHPEIANPEYVEDPNVHAVCNPCGALGFELWQVQSGSTFDDIIIADSVKDVEEFTEATFNKKKDEEKARFDAAEAEKKAKEDAERAKADAERAAAKSSDSGDDEDEDEDEL